MKYYTNRQSNWRAFLNGLTFGAFPGDYPEADWVSSWQRIEQAIAEAEREN